MACGQLGIQLIHMERVKDRVRLITVSLKQLEVLVTLQFFAVVNFKVVLRAVNDIFSEFTQTLIKGPISTRTA